ncbi:MAG: precorrin-8X methylmutase [Methanimicrococcus sp.]|nr:precorrin-8X methylmutase [Methanimicrococcus sp.]
MTTDKNKNYGTLDELAAVTIEIDQAFVDSCSDFGAGTDEAKTIYMKSRTYIQGVVGNKTPEDRIRQRCAVATGDISVAEIMEFRHDPIAAGVAAIQKGAPIFTDINMVKAGITKSGKYASEIICVLDEDENAEIAQKYGITRTSAGYLACRDRLNGAVIAIGNAPSAAITICRLIEKGLRPALIVATPVGFVNAAESKEMVRDMEIPVPSITCIGTRGGTPMAVACVNEIIAIANEKKDE